MFAPPSFSETVLAPLLESRGMDQTALAERLGCAQPTVSRWLNSDLIPEDAILERLTELTELNVMFWKFVREYQGFVRRCKRSGIDPAEFIDAAA